MAEALDVSVGELLGDAVEPEETPEIRQLSEKLARLNEELARQKERSRKWRRAVFFFIAVVALGVLFYELVPLHQRSFPDGIGQSTTAIIGGADGPTTIFLSAAVWHGGRIALAVVVLILAVVGICKTGKR